MAPRGNTFMSEFFLKVVFLTFLGFGIISLTLIFLDKSSFKSLSIAGDLNNQQYLRAKEILIEITERGSNPTDIISVLSDLSWVQEVNLRKHWSLGSVLEISPKNVIAYWNDDSFIAHDGAVLEGDLFRAGSLPYFYGPQGSEKNLIDFYLQVSGVLKKYGHQIIELKLSELGAWSIKTRTGLSLFLGSEELKNRLERFVALEEYRLLKGDSRPVLSIDARYPKGLAVRFADGNFGETSRNLAHREIDL